VTLTEARFLEPEQIRTLLEVARDSRYGPFFEFLVHTGLRRGEALALTWDDVDLQERLLRIRGTLARIDGNLRVLEPKSTKSRRTIPLSNPATDVLARIRARTESERGLAAQLWVDSGHIFVTDIGEPCDPRNALRALTTTARRAGLDGVGLHTLRHSAASVMLSERVPLNVVSQILGHSGNSITADVYGHIAPDVSRRALDILGAALTTSLPASPPASPTPSPSTVTRE
jgi:integrase